MAINQRTITSVPTPTTRTVYDRAPKPKLQNTPRREYAFMRSLFHIPGGGSFGPIGGSVVSINAGFLKTQIVIEPIKFTREQVALMVRIGMSLVPDYAQRVGVSQGKAVLVAEGLADASPAILLNLHLVPDGDGYLLNA